MEASVTDGVCRALLRVIAVVVPARDRAAWLQEWEAELEARRRRLAVRGATGGMQMDLVRRTLGSVFDAAWLRRQFTRDAEILHDVRYGARLLRRKTAFSALTIAVLALGIGSAVGIFSVVDTLLLRGLSYPDADRIVVLFEAETTNRAAIDEVAPGTFLDWRERLRTVETIAAADPAGFTLSGDDEPVALFGMRVSAGFFETFGVAPALGRTFTPEEYRTGQGRVVVLSHGIWARHFGADPAVVGESVRLNGVPVTIVGVMPPAFAPRLLVAAAERGVWTPKTFNEWEYGMRGSRFFNVVAKLKAGVTREQAQAELDGVAARLAREHPQSNAGWTAQVVPLRDHLAGRLRPALGLLLGGVALLLLVAAANTVNLLIAHNADRAQEIAVRAAVGAGRPRLIRQFMAETLLLAALGCALGLGVAYTLARLIATLGPADVPALATLGLDERVLTFAAGLTAVVAVAVGVAPAWQAGAARGRAVRLGQGVAAPRHRFRTGLVVGELAVALMLLAGAGLLVRSLTALLETDPGFAPDRVAALQIFAQRATQPRTPEQLVSYFDRMVERIRQLPEVQEAGAVSAMPFIESNLAMATQIVVDGQPPQSGGNAPTTFVNPATPGYFGAMGIPLVSGRLFDEHDRAGGKPVALVSETLARRYWPATSPVGRALTFQIEGEAHPAEVVGVVGDVRHDGLDRPVRQELFVPFAQHPQSGMTFVARTAGEPAAVINAMKAAVHEVAPRQAIYRTAAVPELVARTWADRRFTLALLAAFAAVALALAAAGVYGVISMLTMQRTREFGLRLALGAGRVEILGMVVRQALPMAAGGLAVGLAVVLIAGGVMSRFLYGVTPADPVTLAGVVAMLAAVALLACLVPARRATRVDPLVALRE